MMEFNIKGQDIIVVGGAGYIGSHICKMISDCGGHPITFDSLSSGHADAVKWGPLERVDVRDRTPLHSVFKKWSHVKTVVHLASSIEVSIGERQPAEFYENNVLGAMNLLNVMRKVEANRLIFSSTCATYGERETMPIRELDSQLPYSVYGKTKLAIEHIIQSYHKAYGLNYVTLRYFNASGADASGKIGEEHDPETHLIPIALMAAAGKRDPLTLFGTDYDTPDGTCLRDYIHVTDIARAHMMAMNKFDDGLQRAEVNIGTGKGYSNLEILKMIETVTGLSVPYTEGARREGDLTQLYADSAYAKSILGFTPIHSDLENIIKTAWGFHKNKWGL